MHEAGLAAEIADALRGERLENARVRLLVSGGHAEPEDFDASLRFHLGAVAPDLAGVAFEIVHVPTDRLCVGCGATFQSVGADEPCPDCGSGGLPLDVKERLEIELVRQGVGSS